MRFRLPTKRETFWLLMAASAVIMWLPTAYTAPLRDVFGTFTAPLSSWLYTGGQTLRRKTVEWSTRPDEIRSAREMEQQLAEQDRQLLALHLRNEELAAELGRLSGLPPELLGPRGRLIPAAVLARDAVAWRESVLIDMGRNVNLKRKQWVGGGVRTFVDRGQDSGLVQRQWTILPLTSPAARKVLGRAVLVGQVELVGQRTARVKLLTDPDSSVPGQLYDPETDRLGPVCLVNGVGPGRLVVERIGLRRAEAGEHNRDGPPAKPGDLIVTAPDTPNLPARLLIGSVHQVKRRDDSAVEYRLSVDPAVDYASLSRLLILDASGGWTGKEGR